MSNEKPENPPSYDESQQSAQQSQNGSQSSNDEKIPEYSGNTSEYPNEKDPYNPNNQNGPFQQGYDPMNDPNVYKVPPQLVNITQANPQHLNPSYPQYQQREQQRWAQGDAPNPGRWKHGAPLEPSVKNPNQKTGGKSFPGRSGATYNNAANK